MKAIVLRELGGPERLRLEEVATPEPGAGELVVKLTAAALNHRDVWIRTGKYADIRLPVILGSDGAGVVSAVGPGAERSLIGREVVVNPSLDWGDDPSAQSSAYRILGLPDAGTYAEYVKVPVQNIVEKPPALSFEEAAALPLAGLTAYRALVTRAELKAGESLVVTGIGGGVSTFALQIARQMGARVLVTSRSDAKLAKAQRLGAAGGANTMAADWVKQLIRANGGERCDCVIDSIGGDILTQALELLRPGGRLVFYGATAGLTREINLRRIFWGQLSLLGSTMGTAREFSRLVAFYRETGLKPVVDRVFPLAQAPEAHARMEQGEQLGKVVLRLSD
jgi:zinc-binding alcohol dehydrogenase/oxidoreductase